MPVKHLEHYMVVSDTLEATCDFYCDVLGLERGARPEMEFDGYWLYAGSTACLHLADRASYTAYRTRVGTPVPHQVEDSGAIDHIAFSATDYDDTIRRIEARQLSYRENSIDEIGLKQVFVQDPNSVTLELNFHSSEEVKSEAD